MENPFLKLLSYEYAHLTSHLAASGLSAQFEHLLALETEHQHNAWFEAKQLNADIDAFMSDVEQAGRMAARDDVHLVERAVRYAALSSSARSTTSQLPPPIVVAATRHGLWPIKTAWKHANALLERKQTSLTIAGLAPYLTEDLVEQSLLDWTEGDLSVGWLDVVVALAPRLKPRRLAAAVERHFAELYCRGDVDAFARLCPYLPEESLRVILTVLATKFWGSDRISEIIAAIAHRLPDALLPEVLDLLRTDFPHYGRDAWTALSPRMSSETLDQALRQVLETEGEFDQVVALAGLLPRLVQLGKPERALELARQRKQWDAERVLLSLLPNLVETGLTEQAFALTEDLPSDHYQGWAIERMAKGMPSDLIDRAITFSRGLTEPYPRFCAFCALAPRLAPAIRESVLADALLAVANIERSEFDNSFRLHSAGLTRARALSQLIPLFLDLGCVARAAEALWQLFEIPSHLLNDHGFSPPSAADKEEYGLLKAVALGRLLPDVDDATAEQLMIPRHLPSNYLRGQVLEAAAPRLKPAALRAWFEQARSVDEIGALAPHVPRLWFDEVLREKRLKFYPEAQVELIGAIAPHLNQAQLQEALDILRSVRDKLGQAVAIAALSSYLEDSDRKLYAEQALAAAQATGSLYDSSRSQALSDIAPYLPLAVLELAIADAKILGYDFLRCQALVALLPALGATGAVEEAWAEAKLLTGTYRAEVMTKLLSVAPDHLLEELPHLAPWMNSGYEGEILIIRAAECLPARSLEHLFKGLLSHISQNGEGVTLLACVAIRTPSKFRERVRIVAEATDQHVAGAEILARLAALSATDDRERLLAEAVERLAPSPFVNQLESAVAAVSSAMPADRMDELTKRLASWPDGSGRNEALASIAPYLGLEQVTDLLGKISRSSEGSRVASALVVRLARLGAVTEAQTRYLTLPSWAKAGAIGELAPYLTVQGLERTIEDARSQGDEQGHGSRTLCALGPHLVPDLHAQGLAAAMEIANKFYRRPAMQVMVQGLLHAPPSTRLQALLQALAISSRRERSELLYDFGALASLVANVGGSMAVRASIIAISDCTRWWR